MYRGGKRINCTELNSRASMYHFILRNSNHDFTRFRLREVILLKVIETHPNGLSISDVRVMRIATAALHTNMVRSVHTEDWDDDTVSRLMKDSVPALLYVALLCRLHSNSSTLR